MVVLWVLTGVALFTSALFDRNKTRQGLKRGFVMFKSILPLFVVVLALVSLLLAVVPSSLLQSFLSGEGIVPFIVALLVGSLMLIPGFVAYPLAAVLRDQGAGVPLLAAFITTLMMVGVLTLPLEIRFFGGRIALLRNALAFVGSVFVALVMALVLT
jgi:uncharacterized membrane protein YraQ (UPF0718 family)